MSKKRPTKRPAAEDDGLKFDRDEGLSFDQADGLDFDGSAESILPDDRSHRVDYPGTVEGDTAADIGHLSAELRAAAKRAEERFEAATDNEFWFTVYFETRAQKDAFLQAVKWLKLGDKYLDGAALAEKLGVRLPDASVPYVKEKPDRKLDELALPLPSE